MHVFLYFTNLRGEVKTSAKKIYREVAYEENINMFKLYADDYKS